MNGCLKPDKDIYIERYSKRICYRPINSYIKKDNIRYPLSNKVGLGPMSSKGSNEILPRQTKVVE